MQTHDSVTKWLDQIRAGNERAVDHLWARFFLQLLTVAQRRLRGRRLGMADEEDIALSAFDSLCRGLRGGSFPDLDSRESLWRLLLVITARKTANQHSYEHRKKRNVERLAQNSNLANDGDELLNSLTSRELTPDIAVECSDQLEHLLQALQHEDLQDIAIMKMDGFTNREISQHVGRSLTTIERKLRVIRGIWKQSS